jgi:hypothetical protein
MPVARMAARFQQHAPSARRVNATLNLVDVVPATGTSSHAAPQAFSRSLSLESYLSKLYSVQIVIEISHNACTRLS